MRASTFWVFRYTRFERVVKGFCLILRCSKQRCSVPAAVLALSVIASRCHLSQSERPWQSAKFPGLYFTPCCRKGSRQALRGDFPPWQSAKNRGASCVTPNFHRRFARFHWQRTLTCGILVKRRKIRKPAHRAFMENPAL